MNTLKRLMAVMLVGGAGFGLFVACGGNNGEGDDCVIDTDCGADQACEGQICVPTCATVDDCGPGEVCEAGDNTQKLICRADSTNNPTNNNTSGTNNNTTTPNNNATLLYEIRIQSTTIGDGCEGTDPGPDIFGVGLEDSTGTQIAYGSVDFNSIQMEGNNQTFAGVLDANGPDLASDVCPDSFDGNVLALGCSDDASGSYIIVGFYDDEGTPVALDATAGQRVRIYEYGGQCSTGSTEDTYDVHICSDTAAAKEGDDTSCDILLIGDGEGETDADVAGF